MAPSFDDIELGPPDAILGVKLRYNADQSSDKLDLGIGAYRDEEGKPYVLNVVRKAQEQIIQDPKATKEYLGQQGDETFIKCTQNFLFGGTDQSSSLKEGRVATVQALSGTGALRIGAELLKRHRPTTVYVPIPTWGNHHAIFENGADLTVKTYRYLNKKTLGLDIDGMLQDLSAAPQGSCIVLHVCAHNPTGVDPTRDQWKQILDVVQKQKLLPFFDSAYQGFASGDIDEDAYAVRLFDQAKDLEFMVSQSYSKNLGLYGERIGALHVVCKSSKAVENVMSQLKIIVRMNYSNPPRHGAAIVARILGSETLSKEWREELTGMVNRIQNMRKGLRAELERIKAPGNWEFITTQNGMFAMTPLTADQVEKLATDHHIYMTSNGRISMAGVTIKRIPYLANAMKVVMEGSS